MRRITSLLPAFALAAVAVVAGSPEAAAASGSDRLTGAWRGSVQFTSGDFAAVKDLEFMYAFHDDGTMTESSNYDAAPPVPPAYGIWRRLGPRSYEARYDFYVSKPAASAEDLIKSGGWLPGGHGTLTQRITLAPDGKSFTSTIQFELFDKDGKSMGSGGQAVAKAQRMQFQAP
jgi:hypothetical protein